MRPPHLIFRFLVFLIITLSISLWLHILWQERNSMVPGADRLFLSYSVNFLLASGIFLILFSVRKKYKNQIGFIYMGGSLLKFLVFFVVFYPGYRADGVVTRSEFGAFFIPYLLCLIFETVFTAKLLLEKPKE